jgi:hypothetical protein
MVKKIITLQKIRNFYEYGFKFDIAESSSCHTLFGYICECAFIIILLPLCILLYGVYMYIRMFPKYQVRYVEVKE